MYQVLWVEDEKHTLVSYRERVVEAFRQAGMDTDVEFAGTTDGAWARICDRPERWCALFLDIQLPDNRDDQAKDLININAGIMILEAYDSAVESGELPARPPTVVFTAVVNPDRLERVREIVRPGRDELLLKTLTAEQFEQRLKGFIKQVAANATASRAS